MYIFYIFSGSIYVCGWKWNTRKGIQQKLFARCASKTDRPLPINNYPSPLYMNQRLVYCIKNKGKWFSVTMLDGSNNSIHEYTILQIQDKQQLETLVLLALYVPYITVHRHTPIVTNERFVNSSVGSWKTSSDRVKIANGDGVSIVGSYDHFRHKLYRVGSMIWVYFAVCLRVWLHINLY